jgi:hypothetical protein
VLEALAEQREEHRHDRRVVRAHPRLEFVEQVPRPLAEREVDRDRDPGPKTPMDEHRKGDRLLAGRGPRPGDRRSRAGGQQQVFGLIADSAIPIAADRPNVKRSIVFIPDGRLAS